MVITYDHESATSIGRIACDLYEFNKHIDGSAHRQKANTVDTDAPLIHLGSATTVQQALTYIDANFGGGGGGATLPINLSDPGSITGTLPITHGGTGLTSVGFANTVLTSTGTIMAWNSIVNANISNSANIAVSKLAAGSEGQILQVVSGTTTWSTAPSGLPGGTDTQLQFNNAGGFGGAANAVYTGGKLRLLANLQYLNSGITGDLSWTPTTTNKTLTLPNATDTLVARATTDALTNKTIVVDSNTLTATSIAAGDVLVSNGTKFVRQAKGVNGTFLGVSGGSVGYFIPAGGSSDWLPFLFTSTDALGDTAYTFDGSGLGNGLHEVRLRIRAVALTGGGDPSGIVMELLNPITVTAGVMAAHTTATIISRVVAEPDIHPSFAEIQVSGTNILVVVTGIFGWTINWSGELRVKTVTSAGTGP